MGQFAVECDPIGTGKWTIRQNDVTCERIQQEVNIALDILEERGIAKRTEFVNAVVEVKQVTCLRMAVKSSDEKEFDCFDGTEGFGMIVLAWDRTALLHELIHYKQAADLDISTSNHIGWKERGFYEADHEYEHQIYLLWYNEGVSPVMEDGTRYYYNPDGGSLGIH